MPAQVILSVPKGKQTLRTVSVIADPDFRTVTGIALYDPYPEVVSSIPEGKTDPQAVSAVDLEHGYVYWFIDGLVSHIILYDPQDLQFEMDSRNTPPHKYR